MIIKKDAQMKQIYSIRKFKYIIFMVVFFIVGCSYTKTEKSLDIFMNNQYITEKISTTTENFSEETTEDYNYLSKIEIDRDNLLKWQWTIEPNKYDDLYFIDKNKIAVKNKDKWGIIDINENIILPFKYSFIGFFCENIAMIKNDKKVFYINTKGENINQESYSDGKNFNEGYCAVSRENKWGFINEYGEMAIEYKFDEAKRFSEGYAAVKIDNKWGFIDKNGNIKIKPIYDEAKEFKNRLSITQKNNKWGIIDKEGDNIVSFIYDEIGEFSEGYASVRIANKWGFIDSNGKICIDIKYAEVGCFSDGKVAVKENENSDLWAYVNAADKIVIDYKLYTAVGGLHSFAGEFKNSIAFASKDYYTIINDKGENIYQSYFFISDCYYNEEFNAISAYVYADDSMTIKKYGYVDLYGKARIEPIFDYTYTLNGKYGVVEKLINNEYKKGIIEIKQ